MKKIILTSFILASVMFSASLVLAETCDSSKTLCNPLKVSSVQDVIYLAVDLAVYVGLAFAVLALIYVGFQFVAAQGNEEKLKDAKKWFYYIIIGLAILISAKAIVEIIKNTLVNSGVVDSSAFNLK